MVMLVLCREISTPVETLKIATENLSSPSSTPSASIEMFTHARCSMGPSDRAVGTALKSSEPTAQSVVSMVSESYANHR